MRFLRFDLRGFALAARTARETHRKKRRAEAYVRVADTLSSRYLLGPRPNNAEARAARLYAAATRALLVAGFTEEPNAEGSPASLAIARLASARGRLRSELRRAFLLGLPWAVIATVLVVVATQLPPLRSVVSPTNFAARKAWRTSGPSFGGAPTEGRMPRSSGDAPYFFHTDDQDEPWIEIDLGATKSVHAFKVENRADCCQERASPLVLETSVDRESWTFAARRRGMFSSWSGDFLARDARYVRLRSERKTSLHLRQVKIY